MTGGFGQGGAGIGGMGTGGGTGGSTVTGLGGGACGDGMPSVDEECDDANQDENDGCTSDCQAEMLDSCPSSPQSLAFLGAVGDEIAVTGDTTDAMPDLKLGGEGSCQSDGRDEWLAVRMLAAGTVEARLTALTGFGGNQENAVLHVRRGCEDKVYADELTCFDTNGTTQGVATVQVFARAGEVVYFAVDGDGGNEDGTYDLTVTMTSVCGDDMPMGMEQCDDQTTGCRGCMKTTTECGGALGLGVYDPLGGHCYVVVEASPQTFFDARTACVFEGGDLLTIDPMDGMLPASIGEVWVGLADLVAGDATSEFRWLGNDTVGGLTFVADEDPNKLRCATRNPIAQLDDRLCGQDHGFVCELTFDNP